MEWKFNYRKIKTRRVQYYNRQISKSVSYGWRYFMSANI